jgi:DNA-binding beta-propeller fold protein YncE
MTASLVAACGGGNNSTDASHALDASDASDTPLVADADTSMSPSLPLVLVNDVALPGRATRWDYQEIDAAHGHLVIAHMGDNEVVVVSLADGSTLARIPNVATVRGIAVAASANRIFASAAATNQLVSIDAVTLMETGRVATGNAPDGVAWDPTDQMVGVSDQADGALSIIAGSGAGTRMQVRLGSETGNVVYDAGRHRFWITVVRTTVPDQLAAVDPTTAMVLERIDLPGCSGAHGLRIHPDGQSALIACEGNSIFVRLDLATHTLATAPVGNVPDVLSIDTSLGWLYVASESGDLTVFDITQPGLVDIDDEHPDDNAHSVAVDPMTHRVYFPLVHGSGSTPVLRIMRPAGT